MCFGGAVSMLPGRRKNRWPAGMCSGLGVGNLNLNLIFIDYPTLRNLFPSLDLSCLLCRVGGDNKKPLHFYHHRHLLLSIPTPH